MNDLAKRGPIGFKEPKVKRSTKAGMLHMGRVKALPCVVCLQPGPSSAHHCRSHYTLRDDFKTIPLCWECHQGQFGYHNDKSNWEAKNGADIEFLPIVADMLKGEWNDPRGF